VGKWKRGRYEEKKSGDTSLHSSQAGPHPVCLFKTIYYLYEEWYHCYTMVLFTIK